MSNAALFNLKFVLRYASMILLVLCFLGFTPVQTEWKAEQLDKANTGKDNASLTVEEKEAIQYINLARMYPQLFVKLELKDYNGPAGCNSTMYIGSSYKASLIKCLEDMKPMQALTVEQYLNDQARCFAEEIGTSGRDDHNRLHCTTIPAGECISFYLHNGRDIAMDLLIDDGIVSLSHREICLDKAFTKVGASSHDHTKWKVCIVIDFDR